MLLFCVATPALANEVTYTGTVPCVFVNTENGTPIQSKSEYVNATMNIETFGLGGYDNIGTNEQPLNIQIRGRGNWTWRSFDKKPYKIKMEEGAELLGMSKNKHWALLSHPDDPTGFYRNTLGFEVSRMLGMKYTSEQRPVEFVLNGEYLGLYMLTETIRVGKRRLDIDAEDDLLEEPDKVGQGGWLVEFDNYDDESQISIDVSDTYLKKFLITYHTPEELSDIQKDWLTSQFQSIKDAIFTSDSTSTDWETLIDIDALSRYCMIAEITSHQEAFVGSCFLYKESGETKWKFGPVWDFGSSLWEFYRGFMWEDNYFGKTIMTEMSKFNNIQNKLREIWPQFYANAYPHLDEFIEQFADQVSEAVKNDALRWPQYGHGDASYNCEYAKTCIRSRIEWLNKQWGAHTTNIQRQNANDVNNNGYIYSLSGRRVSNEKSVSNRIIIKDGRKYIKQ